ncbi:MAG: glycosyltransferase family 39 protein [Elusimicrobiota bacterium]|nr:glycosyltransferase family 39 protein [Elusimicrobiota bacterium]
MPLNGFKPALKVLAAAGLLGCFAWLAFQSALRESATFDESFNISSGYSVWSTGRRPLSQPNPPLLLRWLSAPLLAQQLRPFDEAAYRAGPRTYSFSFLYSNTAAPDILLNRCRAANIVLGLLLALLTGLWAFRLAGAAAGFSALAVFAFMPPLLAHAHLATADIGNALLCTAACYFLWRGARAPGRGAAAAAGFACGLAMAGKYTAGIIAPLGLFYLYSWGGTRLKWFAFWGAGAALGVWLGCFPVSPFEWLMTGFSVFRELKGGHETYVLGKMGTSGSWYYFPLAFLIKTPLPALLLALAGFYGFDRRRPGDSERLRYLIVPAACWMLLGVFSNTQVGVRHILPVYPLLCVWAGLASAALWAGGRLAHRGAVCLLFAWLAAGTLLAFPGYISYFNEAAGGARGGHRYLLDSNLDWGQGLKELGAYVKEQGAGHIYLSYFGCGDPHAYGIKYAPVLMTVCSKLPGDGLPPEGQEKKLLAVSVSNRLGVYYQPHTLFSWLDSRRPVRIISDSIWVYDVTGDPAAQKLLADPRLTR